MTKKTKWDVYKYSLEDLLRFFFWEGFPIEHELLCHQERNNCVIMELQLPESLQQLGPVSVHFVCRLVGSDVAGASLQWCKLIPTRYEAKCIHIATDANSESQSLRGASCRRYFMSHINTFWVLFVYAVVKLWNNTSKWIIHKTNKAHFDGCLNVEMSDLWCGISRCFPIEIVIWMTIFKLDFFQHVAGIAHQAAVGLYCAVVPWAWILLEYTKFSTTKHWVKTKTRSIWFFERIES